MSKNSAFRSVAACAVAALIATSAPALSLPTFVDILPTIDMPDESTDGVPVPSTRGSTRQP